MKLWTLLLGIIVIFAIVCSPVLAISKSELISYYKGQSVPAMPIPTPTVTPTPAPTQNPQIPSRFFPYPSKKPWDDSSFNQPSVDWKTEDDKIADYVAQKSNRFIWEYFINIFDNDATGSYAADLPPKGKPNIYLYSDRDLTAQVRLAPEYAITVSEPVYQPGKGWQAEIMNGSLNGNGDFLFYEALGSDFEWQKEEGFVIRAASRSQDMASMLGQYGFNEKETAEFIEYWACHLIGDMDFVFYPQETAAVNQDMPLYIRPKPDHAMRIWFCAEPFVSVPGPVTHSEKIVREGFYVVEWGVIIDDEYWINHSPASSEVVL